MTAPEFFAHNYTALRPYTPTKWMRRMFARLIAGEPPSLVDLPTGAGKTDVIVIWLIALAWYAHHRGDSQPVPRRLIWVVNRRVLVQQVYDLAESLNLSFKAHSGPVSELAAHLRSLCGQNSKAAFNVVQLRGQRLDDREWALDPTVPQLIIGTVDQIGSRLLFQGYGLGKWSRPMQAGLFGVDAWVCVDEAHLVPAFAVTLRQIREVASRPLDATVPEPISTFFGQLPFWITELSATPGLPAPKYGKAFRIEPEDETDEAIADRLLAKRTRRVIWKPQPEKKHLVRDMAEEATRIAREKPGSAIAVFCYKPDDAKKICDKIEKDYEGRVLLITGRVRGYERDRLSKNDLFHRFRLGESGLPDANTLPTFLVGTAAAEVGLDADADAIVCDFADLLTLIQRLGRLDRRGQMSQRAMAANTPPPTMTIIGGCTGKITKAQLDTLAEKLGAATPSNGFEYGAEFFTGMPWSVVVGKEEGDGDENEADSAPETKQAKGSPKPGVKDAVDSATWHVLALSPKTSAASAAPAENSEADSNNAETGEKTSTNAPFASQEARQPAGWLDDALAAITAGPVVLPPLSDAVLRPWAATTPRPSKFLPVHPWLYGLLPDKEGTPLMGIAFRLELDILQHCREFDENDGETDRTWEKVAKCLTAFPPLNSELHFVPIDKAREWLEGLHDGQRPALAHFDGESWTDSISADALTSNAVLVLPSSTSPASLADVIPKGGNEGESQRCWDVCEALAKDGAKYRRTVTIKSGQIKPRESNEGDVYRIPEVGTEGESVEAADEQEAESNDEPAPKLDETKWKVTGVKLSFSQGGISFELRYYKPRRDEGIVLDLLPDHHAAAAEHARRIAQALAPNNVPLASLLGRTAGDHDKGKDHLKWQQAMGNTPAWRSAEGHDDFIQVAKPVIENPGQAGGYRHEWGTLWRVKDDSTPIAPDSDAATEAFLRDLYLHGIAAHHGYFRPSMPDRGFDSKRPGGQSQLRLEAIERSARLQRQLGYWRLAYLESLIKIADVTASRDAQPEEAEDES